MRLAKQSVDVVVGDRFEDVGLVGLGLGCDAVEDVGQRLVGLLHSQTHEALGGVLVEQHHQDDPPAQARFLSR